MFEDTDNRGQVGIGTLIVFIAMVLVAAIAAGVLVNTAGFLQESAEQTGQEAQGEVSDRIDVVSVYAADITDDTTTEYDNITITVRKASGSDDISLDDTTYTFLGPDGTASGTLSDSTAGVTKTAVSNNDPTILRNESDRVEIEVQVSQIETDALLPGEEFQIQLTTSSGASTYVEGRIPDTAEEGGVVEV
ncbi:archaellin/type IV pilin N-terminal domain-containing protein [Salinigranum sp.]|uniref:archaellin/type IV pilin N-terminal domain-containing protein n=1 Tax=Salinigranum sp. TaxID=1966351 RepID=UPI0035661BD5